MPDAPIAADVKPWRTGAEEPFIRVRSVTKTFGSVTAVNNVSMDIYKGELFCLLGGSGCGKTTLLRMLAGFETPTSGAIEIDGQDVAGVAPHDRPTNMMFQSYALFPHMTVARNIGYGLRRDGIDKDEIGERVEAMLHLVKLGGFGERKPNQLSGGQRQRVALARALIKQPKLLLLDEPLGALDKKLREETQFELVNIQESLGVTFIVVTHDQEEAMTLSTRIGIMNEGRIEQTGEPLEIYEFPQNRFVADFIGSVNMIEGVVAEDEPDHIIIRSEQLGGLIHVPHGVACSPNQTLWYALRPEKLEITREQIQSENSVPGVVEDIAYMGNQSIYRVRMASGMIMRIAQTNRARGEEGILWDEEVHVSWAPGAGVVLTS
ncbi:MAG: ABC transporter ATP-binding protein [Pseudomonadota bacterium]